MPGLLMPSAVPMGPSLVAGAPAGTNVLGLDVFQGAPALSGMVAPIEAPVGGMPPEVKEQLEQLREDMNKMKTAADEAAKSGDEGGSKFKQMLADEIKEKIKELEAKHPVPVMPPPPSTMPMPLMGGLSMPTLPPLPPPGALPGLLPPPPGPPLMPPRPGMLPPGPRPAQDMHRMMTLYQNPELAADFTQQQALEYEQAKANSMSMEPEVIELAHHYNLSDRHARLLDEQLKKRNNTYDDDVAAMYEILKGAKNPADLLMVSIRWMAEGVFRGTLTPNPDVEKAAKKYKLDAPSACKLAEILEGRDDPDLDLRKICSHLERSNRPSALVMMMLKDLKAGNPVEESTKQPAIGSYLHKEETKEQQRRASKSTRGNSRSRRDRSRSRGRGRSRSRGRDRSRSRGARAKSRSRGRGRSRSRSRGRGRD